MASSRKKQDEKNLKILRELGAHSLNKYCFDCNQRGPTYVNMTIGSFICTKCSGMLRGLTPPHRVKSISMTTFSSEEIDFLKKHGNQNCRATWLGLHEGALPIGTDEQSIKDFMIEKYERKRYYLEPTMTNGFQTTTPVPVTPSEPKMIHTSPTTLMNGSGRKRPEIVGGIKTPPTLFAVHFDNLNNNNPPQQQTEMFANFDDNPVFITNGLKQSSIPSAFDNFTPTIQQPPIVAPRQDKYAALKDLDNALKQNTTIDWNSSGSNGSLYSSPTTSGSVYSSPSPQSSIFGSPSQGQFVGTFQCQNQEAATTTFSNPFNANPFRDTIKTNGFNGNVWSGNPFKVGATGNLNSNNPFL